MEYFKKYKIGMRTIKTGISVSLSMFIASLFNLKSPIFVGIGAIMAMQSSVSESFISGKNRIIGTIVGAIVGLFFSYLLPQNYIFLGLGVIIVIYIHNLMNWKQSLTLSAIVFIAIFLNQESARIPYATNRLFDTFIGISVSMLVNYFIAAPNSKKLFLEAKTNLYYVIKDLIHNILTRQNQVNLDIFKKDMLSLETLFESYKQDLHMNVSNSQISESSIKILAIFDDIYNDMSTLIKLNVNPVLSDENLFMLKELYSSTIFIQSEKEQNQLDVIYNYHLFNILSNLTDINKVLEKKL